MFRTLLRLTFPAVLGFSASLFPNAIRAADASQSGIAGVPCEEFAFDFFHQLSGDAQFDPAKDLNLAFSPFSLACVLDVLRLGATGNAEKELNAALHLEQSSPGAEARITARGVTLSAGNSLWIGTRFHPKAEFLHTADTRFGDVVFTADFDQPQQAAKRINGWISDKTAGHINDLISPANLVGAGMVVANAVYFKGDWETPFKAAATSDKPFHLISGKEIPVPQMFHQGHYRYAEKDGVQILELPYQGGDVSMMLILPSQGAAPLNRLERELNAKWLRDAIASQTSVSVAVTLPRFKFSSEPAEIVGDLNALGIRSMFHSSLDFAKITDDKLAVTAFKHRAWLEVNEKGTEAAAATGAAMRVLAMPVPAAKPIQFVADHPFVFVIRHSPTGTPLFVGRVSDPAREK